MKFEITRKYVTQLLYAEVYHEHSGLMRRTPLVKVMGLCFLLLVGMCSLLQTGFGWTVRNAVILQVATAGASGHTSGVCQFPLNPSTYLCKVFKKEHYMLSFEPDFVIEFRDKL